ncbi:hypothetical protein [Variovorax guangxiensis]|uniref:hypothetical protein n=1 Tax=Variovorax guangxiensis TaxID=1775474 RepID=UPI00285821B0|nr:hypothetical protein [Variovorax guangxiensis]MDR6859919.1 hypothetical protein [Variovorax guangxiensis]
MTQAYRWTPIPDIYNRMVIGDVGAKTLTATTSAAMGRTCAAGVVERQSRLANTVGP